MSVSILNSIHWSEKIYRTVAVIKIPVFCFLLFVLPYGLYAQQHKYYQQELPVYPLTQHLFGGLMANRSGKPAEALLSYTLQAPGRLINDSFTTTIKPGIAPLLSDSFISYSGHFDPAAWLLPGTYSFAMQLIISGDTIHAERTFLVPSYLIKLEKIDSNTVEVLTEPRVKGIGVYVCLNNAAKKRGRGKPAGCFYTTETRVNRLKFRPDTSATYTYELSVYAEDRLIGKTGFKAWEELPGSIPLQGSDHKTPAPVTHGKVQLNATVGVEYGYTNVRYANQLSATQYARFFFKPTITVLGVPLTFNSMLSTENNRNYPLNFFQFGFDAGKFRSDFQNNAIKDQLETAHRLELNAAELSDVNRQLKKYKRPDFTALNTGANDSLGTLLKRKLGRQRKAQKVQALDLKVQGLEARKQSLEYECYKDSVYLSVRRWNEPDLDTVQRFLKKQRYKNLTSTLLAIRSFNVGLCTPHYSDLTLSQVPLQGVHADLKFNKWFVSATAGNRIGFQPALGLRALLQPAFENKTYAGKLGISNRRTHTSVYVAYFYFENKPDSFNRSPRQNTILSAGLENRFLPWLLLSGELAKSFYQSNSTDAFGGERYRIGNSFSKDYGNISFHSSLTINAGSATELSATLKRIGNGYYTLGIPYLRNDYMEYSLAWKQFYWLRQLETELSYMRNRDNLEGNKANTTILTGYGASLKTHFRTRPNLLVLYKPFNSSFSFEQHLFNPVNTQPNIITQQFYLFHATVFYTKKTRGGSLLNTSLSYNRSNNQNSQGNLYRLESVSGNMNLVDKQGRQLAYVVSLYRSSAGANNSMLHDLSYSAGVIKNKVRATIGGIGQWVNDGRQRRGVYSQAAYAFQSFTISCRLSSNYLQGNWFVNNPSFEHAVYVFLEWRL